jgi:hypothetical protein
MAVDRLQDNWRYCRKCYSLFWYGNPTMGFVPRGMITTPAEAGATISFLIERTSPSKLENATGRDFLTSRPILLRRH